jgi:hypothetical protein
MMKFIPPPYAYNILEDDQDMFVRAVSDALAHPIKRYSRCRVCVWCLTDIHVSCSFIPERMLLSSLGERILSFLDVDWEGKAKLIMQKRKSGTLGEVCLLYSSAASFTHLNYLSLQWFDL